MILESDTNCYCGNQSGLRKKNGESNTDAQETVRERDRPTIWNTW